MGAAKCASPGGVVKDFCGISASSEGPRLVLLDAEMTFELQFRVVGGDGFEPPTPAL